MKKRLFLVFFILTLFACLFGVNANADDGYMSQNDARYFLAFVYNSDTDHVTEEALADDIYYKMLTGELSNNPTYEKAAKVAFLSYMDARITDTLEKANVATKTSRDYLIKYCSDELEDESKGLVTGIYKENIQKSIFKMADAEDALPLIDTVTDIAENPDKYLDDLKAISSAFTYVYGQNVTSLYTYFDVAQSCVYLKSTEGAYETAMAYTILALKDSNFLSYAVKLIPGISSWEDWIDKMDYWAEYVYDMKKELSSGNRDFQWILFHPNCDELETEVLWYTGGQVYAPKMEREGYILEGWYLDEDCTIGPVKNDFVPEEDVVYLYAKWTPRYFNISFKSNCSEVDDYNYKLDRLNVNWYEPTFKRVGYLFNGWYWDSGCKNPVKGEFEITGDMTFYAGWVCQYAYTSVNGQAGIYGINHWEKDIGGNRITDLVIPEKLGGLPVTEVDLDLDARAITGLTFPNSMKTIKEWSFSWFTSLKKVVLNDGITVIEEGAFARSTQIETLSLGKNLKTIGDDAFVNCSKITEIDLPEGLVSIGSDAFSNCGMTEVKIPDSVTFLGDRAFSSCENLKRVIIGKGLTDIDSSVFAYCNSLESITVSADNQSYTSVDGVLYSKDMTILCKYPSAKTDKSFKVPATVKTIADKAFENATFLESIDFSNVLDLGESTFYGCMGLKTITLPDGIKELKGNLFYECSSLSEVVIPDGVELISWGCFEGCTSLTSITIPESVTDIWDYAFSGCPLTEIKLPSELTYICQGTFYGCKNLETIKIPEKVTTIDSYAFYDCTSLTVVEIPKAVTEIIWYAFLNCTAIEDVYYTGTEDDWNLITVYVDNESVTNANIHFEKSIPEVTAVTVTGSFKAFGDALKEVTVELLNEGEVVDTKTLVGNSGTYTFEEVTEGRYTVKVSKTKHAPREYTITVEDADVTQDVEIWLYGDVTADGIVNNNDVMQINRKNANLSSVFSLTENADYRLKVANVTASTNTDAIINNTDVIQINRMNANLSSVFDRIA